MSLDLVIENVTITTADGSTDPGVGIGVADGKIAAISATDQLPDADRTIEGGGNHLVPGIIDAHVHTRDPGSTYREDWETATRAAAAGGVTSIIAMPNTDPPGNTPEDMENIYDIAAKNALVDYQSYALLSKESVDKVEELIATGAVGFKCFLTESQVADFSLANDGELHDAMESIAETGKRIGFHEENNDISQYYREKFEREGKTDPIYHSQSRPVVAENEAVSRMILFGEDTGCPVHMFHVSSGTAAETVAKAKHAGADVTAETLPQYLWFSESDMEEKGNLMRQNPPIRNQAEQDLLWETGIFGDGVDYIASDHAPSTDEEKGVEDPYQSTWDVKSGFVGLETQIPSMLTFVNQNRISLEKVVDMYSRRPAQIWGLHPQKGSLQVGTDADFTLIDLEDEWTLDRHSLHSKNTPTPYDGEQFQGSISQTIVRGNVVYDGEVHAEPGDGRKIQVD